MTDQESGRPVAQQEGTDWLLVAIVISPFVAGFAAASSIFLDGNYEIAALAITAVLVIATVGATFYYGGGWFKYGKL